MLILRPADERGLTRTGWLDSRHTFSFGRYHDARWMGFGALRVLNEDRVAPGAGFEEHGHANMEILSWVLQGAMAHRDSTGAGGVIHPGDLQRMTAGHGIRHSEMNASPDAPLHFLQLWIQPDRSNLAPGYAQRRFASEALAHGWTRLASPAAEATDDALPLHASARIWAWVPPANAHVSLALASPRAWLQVTRGSVRANGCPLQAGDGLGLHQEEVLDLQALTASSLLLVELP